MDLIVLSWLRISSFNFYVSEQQARADLDGNTPAFTCALCQAHWATLPMDWPCTVLFHAASNVLPKVS